MWTEKLKKIISGLLIFFLLFSLTVHVPLLQFFSTQTFAEEKEFFNLVSIIVDEDTYDATKTKLVRYSKDIQAKLENTQVVILPTPSNASVFDIASLNESLFLEGYKSVKDDVDFESRLIGTVLVGKIPVPVVFDDADSGKSILPYVDFTEKSYIFDQVSKKYQKSELADSELVPEVWHGVISPNTGDFDTDIQAIEDYFDKNHDFYLGEGVFDQEKGVIDGKDTPAPESYEPYVFYYDQFRESEALQYQKYVGYQMYQQNIEDITYRRYGKDLAEKVKNQVLGVQNLEIQDLLKKVDPEFDISGFSGGPDVNSSSDILTRYITDNATKKYLEIFNSSTLGDMRKYIYNAGRYNKSGSDINLDMPPFLISVLDQVSAEVIKNVNTSLETEITNIVKNGLSRKVVVPTEYKNINGPSICSQTYTGFFYGKAAQEMTSAAQCSIYRGSTIASGTLVEANRGYNVELTEADLALCQGDFRSGDTAAENVSKGYWGGNTPLNFDAPANGNYTSFSLKNNDLQGGIRSVFDIRGAKEISDTTKVPSPLDCFTDAVLLQTYDQKAVTRGSGEESETVCEENFQAPVLGKARSGAWSCRMINAKKSVSDFTTLFNTYYASVGQCSAETYILDSTSFSRKVGQLCSSSDSEGNSSSSCCVSNESYSFKSIDSYILHTSPTDAEFGAETQSLFTPSLPIDKNRYIDFIGAKGGAAPSYGYQKIDFPQLFRVTPDAGQDLTLENIELKVKAHLDAVSAQMNQVIQNSNPASLSGTERDLYNLLKTQGSFPSANIDLYTLLKNKPLEVFTIENQSKEISYFDTLVFAVYWNNLTTVSSKYKFIFENYLGNQFEGNEFAFHLPKSKKSYETTYLAAPGDAQNMYIKLDPEAKGIHPYADILSQNLALQSVLLTGNVPEPEYEDTFKCGPPDGVPIWEWIPAVICWLKDMLPPKIKIGQGSCGYDTLFLDEEEREELLACEGDVNKNGLNDCLEGKLTGGSLKLQSDAGRYFYNTPGFLQTQILDAVGDIVTFDSTSFVENTLSRVEIPKDPEIAFAGSNIEVIYDTSIPALSTAEKLKEAQKYISFSSSSQRAYQGEIKTYFYGKGDDANVFFTARLQAKDTQGTTLIDLKSTQEKIEIRGDQVFLNSYVVEADGIYSIDNTIHVSAEQNIFIADGAQISTETAASSLSSLSRAKEKLLLTVHNYSQAGNILPLNYPVTLELSQEGKTVFQESDITQAKLSKAYPFFTAKSSGRYEMKLTDASGFQSYKTIDILPEVATKLNPVLSTSLMETGGNISTHLVTIEDQFGNPASGEVYTIDLSLDGKGLIFDTNGEKEISYQVVEGYKAFRLKSTGSADENVLSITLKDISGKTITQTSSPLRTVEDIKLSIVALDGTPKVGNLKYRYALTFNDAEGQLLSDLNSRVYLNIGKLYGKVEESYVSVQGGKAEVSFTTSTLAGEKIPLEIQLEGGNEIYKAYTDILPEAPIKIDLQLSRAQIEASKDETALLDAILKDRYNNEVFSDNTTLLQAQIHDQSKAIISLNIPEKQAVRGKAQFQISATDIPGIAYFKVGSVPSLSTNTFDLIGQAPFERTQLVIPTFKKSDGTLSVTGSAFFKIFSPTKYISKFSTQSGLENSEVYLDLSEVLQKQVLDFWKQTNKLEVSGVGENAGSIETFFFWDKEDIEDSAYNGMYSVLLGAPYGDITQENYLAGALLFERNNSSLAVSSLLNTPYVFHDVFSLEKNGFLGALQSSDITQDIQFSADFDSEGRLIVDVHNEALEAYIGRVYYNISEKSDISLDIDESLGYSVETRGEDVFVKSPSGKEVFEAYEVGRFQRKSGTFIQVDTSYVGPGIQILLKNGEQTFGTMKISGVFETNITRDTALLNTKLKTLADTLIVHLASNQYSSRDVESDANTSSVKFYYQDPFADTYALDEFHNTSMLGLESSREEAGIGWEASNTMLLNFSAGQSVGDSTKKFQSFSLINLGDPVASLKALKKTFSQGGETKSFDPTVGELLEKNPDLIGFQTFDYNKDAAIDVLTVQKDGYLKLFENTPVEGGFVEHGSLAYAADGGSVRLVKTGDFTADGYDDIFFVTETGKPMLFNNVEKDFIRQDLSSSFSLTGSIIQAEAYDMDSDGKDDIVTLDDRGEIHIFYGSGTEQNPIFTKKFIGDGYAIKLSDTVINQGGAVYFDGLTQIRPDIAQAMLLESQEYLQTVNQDILSGGPEAGQDTPTPEFIDDSLVGSFLYVSLPYIPTDYDETDLPAETLLESLDTQLDTIGGSPEAESMSGTTAELEDFLTDYDDYIEYSGYQNTYTSDTYFLRSQYAGLEGIEVSKTFTDSNSGTLQTGDTVYFDISLKNTSSRRINNVAYVDTLPKYFNFVDENFTILTQDNVVVPRKRGIAEYNIVLDGFYLDPGEETKVRYELKTLPLSYGHIQVGLYETGEVGDDIYGDIILKKDAKNCGKEADIFRSTAVRSYLAGKIVPTCEEDIVDIGNTFPELTDTNDDGIPDYLQDLIGSSNNIGNIDGNLPANATPEQIAAYNQSLLDNANLQNIQEYGDTILEDLGVDSDSDGVPDSDDTMDETDGATDFMGALDTINEAVDEISEDIDELVQGLSCGFGGGSCFANPLNWAPLAPGSAPTLMGMPLGPLTPNTGIPVFSALTGRQASCGLSPCCLPSVWPMTSQAFVPGPFCGPSSAGGSRGTWASTNFVRLFATPTLTGGAGIAVCFGGPAIVAGNANPMGVHPIVPGGNCIVAAMPLFGCEGGEGDPGVLGYPFPGDGFDVIHGNCDGDVSSPLATPQTLQDAFVQDYLEYLRTGVKPASLYEDYVEEFTRVSQEGSGNFYLPTQPLINIGNSNTSAMMSTSIDLDVSALASGNFQDVVQIQNKRVGAFPNFLMDWVERQLDEITSKLTNLPKVFVVLPDFGGVFDFSWKNFGTDMKQNAQEDAQKADSQRAEKQGELTALRSQKSALDCSGTARVQCLALDLRIAKVSGVGGGAGKETLSGIKEAYDFIGNIPLINIETETINVNVPWIDPSELNRFSVDWKYTLEQWKGELDAAKNSWSLGAACTQETEAERTRCQQENSVKEKAYLDASAFVNSLETNIEILQEYKEFPERLAKLINIKEVWLEQILCNIEAIASLLGEWIGSNGKRFKAWVELFILIKAVLKSWQLLLDVFNGYEEECHECKNERQDLQNFIFRLISAIIPSPPIIQFPKWPDIIIDLHNIRAGMTIYMPDFQMNMRPIVLPTLPPLNLPRVPTAGFTLPPLPTLPRFTIPELPELPSLPSIELPDLPPPPKIPALFGAVEGILNIMKLVTKVMCILKNSPFVPEWRAGDQIAFLTERNGYLPLDFIDIQPPAFSYSAISAIKVSAYVNFEFETEFIIEAVRAITAPLDKATNNIVNMFNIQISDMSPGADSVPTDINLNIETDGSVTPEISLAPLDENPEGIYLIAGALAHKFQKLIVYLSENKDVTLTNSDFQAYVGKQLSSTTITSDPRTQELQALWADVAELTYSKEDAFIEELQKNNTEKFKVLGDIISTEIEYTKQQKKMLDDMKTPSYLTQVAADTSPKTRFTQYTGLLEPYNIKMLDASIQLVSGPSEETVAEQEALSDKADTLMQEVRGGLSAYKEAGLLAATSTTSTSSSSSAGSCDISGEYEYRYEGIYVREYGKNYRLFEYTDMLRGDEEPTILDMDADGDDDILYLAQGKLYFKENRKQNPVENHVSGNPLILSASSNKFFNGDIFYEALNYFTEANVSDGAINVEFQKPSDPTLKNFRMTYHTIVDRYINDRDDFTPSIFDTHIVDALSDIPSHPSTTQTSNYTISKHLATLSYAGAMAGAKLTTEKLENIKTQLAGNTKIGLTAKTQIHAGNTSFRITYYFGTDTENPQELSVPAYSTLVFQTPVSITGLSGDAYVSAGINEDILGTDILDYIGKPLLPGSKISYTGNTSPLDASSHIDIRYYDDSLLQMDMRDITSYTLYDLGARASQEHKIRLQVPNDFYYARITSFKNDILGTLSQQILLAPQTSADTLAPQIGLNQKIRIPVYQSQLVDLTPYIYEDGGFAGIQNVRIDFDLSVDSDGDGNAKNDADTDKISITKTSARITILFGPYENIFEKQINIILIDDNGNIASKEIGFEVYPPDPSIDGIENNTITGQIDETLLDEPVRLYRYRGGVVQKLQKLGGGDLVETDAQGNYTFETAQTASGLTLSYSGSLLANIDEYTGRIDMLGPLTTTRVIPSNNPSNDSIYPEIQILQAGEPLFRQFVKIPEGEVERVTDLNNLDETGVYMKLLDQERFASYRIPLGVEFNPGSVSVYLSSDSEKDSVMTIFQDGRIYINESLYRLEYRTFGTEASLVLVQKGTNTDIAQVVYHMQASYILR